VFSEMKSPQFCYQYLLILFIFTQIASVENSSYF
jgi:hypothetical protein